MALVVDSVSGYRYTLDDVGMFRNLKGVQIYSKIYNKLLWLASTILHPFLGLFRREPQPQNVELATILDFWRNMVLGRSGDAHSHLMEYVCLNP